VVPPFGTAGRHWCASGGRPDTLTDEARTDEHLVGAERTSFRCDSTSCGSPSTVSHRGESDIRESCGLIPLLSIAWVRLIRRWLIDDLRPVLLVERMRGGRWRSLQSKDGPGIYRAIRRRGHERGRIQRRECILLERGIIVRPGWIRRRHWRYILRSERCRVLQRLHACVLLLLIRWFPESGVILFHRIRRADTPPPIHCAPKASCRRHHWPCWLCHLSRGELSVKVVCMSGVHWQVLRLRVTGECVRVGIVRQGFAQLVLNSTQHFSLHAHRATRKNSPAKLTDRSLAVQHERYGSSKR
jgi:hypothetical protein